jgi:hypothetical protein
MGLITNLIMKLFSVMLCFDNDTYVNYMLMLMIDIDAMWWLLVTIIWCYIMMFKISNWWYMKMFMISVMIVYD